MTPCWIALNASATSPYGKVHLPMKAGKRRSRNKHQAVWEEVNGPVPAWGELHHLCRTQACYRPTHLIVVGKIAHYFLHGVYRATCKRGHPWTEENTGRHHGWRRCLVCHAASERRRRSKVAA